MKGPDVAPFISTREQYERALDRMKQAARRLRLAKAARFRRSDFVDYEEELDAAKRAFELVRQELE